jgi:hypothetical protein
MPFSKFCIVPLMLIGLLVNGQKLSSILLDSLTQNPVAYATVRLKNQGMITNEEGRFNFQFDDSINENDTLFISCIGYASIGKPIKAFKDGIIFLSQKAIELDPVIVSNRNFTPEEIIELVKNKINANYQFGLTKKRLFLRESNGQLIEKIEYSKFESSIEAFNKGFLDSVLYTLPKDIHYYTEVLADLYGGSDAEIQKLDLIKASELYDKSKQLDAEALERKFNTIIKENVKTDSYFKVKSGLFGTKMDAEDLFGSEVDSTDVEALNRKLEEAKKNEVSKKKHFTDHKKRALANLYKNQPILEDTDFNMLWKPRKYRFALKEFTFMGDIAVYVLTFEPKGSADYGGTLYINSDDFAIMRMDFENVGPLRKFNLLGVSLNEYLAKGSMIFSQGDDKKYSLRYFDVEKGTEVGFRRPLKIIEKNKNTKGRRKQNELSLKINAAFNGLNRQELVVFDIQRINKGDYDALPEGNQVLPTYMPNYDPDFWEGYNIMEPNRAIKEFTSEVVVGTERPKSGF